MSEERGYFDAQFSSGHLFHGFTTHTLPSARFARHRSPLPSIPKLTSYISNDDNWIDGTLVYDGTKDMMTLWSAGDTQGIEEGNDRLCYSMTVEVRVARRLRAH